MLSDEHHTVISSTVLGPVKEKARCPEVFVFVKGMRKFFLNSYVRFDFG